MNITGQLVWTDYLKAQSLYRRPVWWARLLQYVAIVALIAGYVIFMVPSIRAHGLAGALPYLWLPIVAILALVLNRFALLPMRVRRIYEQDKAMQAPVKYEITPAGLKSSDQNGRANRRWKDLRKWKEDRDYLLLYVSDVQFLLIPKRFCTPEQIETLHNQLRQHKVIQVGTITRRSMIIAVVIVFLIALGAILGVVFRNPRP